MTVRINHSFYEKLDPEKVDEAMEKATVQVLYKLYNECVDKSPYRTGKLQESHSHDHEVSDHKVTAQVRNSAKYWSYVEFGTSKMGARHWVLHALTDVNPVKEFGRSFKAYYKPGK